MQHPTPDDRSRPGRTAPRTRDEVPPPATVEALQRALAVARDRTSFLAAASKLLASSLDYETSLATVARMSVPRLADWCSVDVVESDSVRRLTVVHADPAKEQLARAMVQRYPPDLHRAEGAAKVLRTGRPVLLSHIDESTLAAIARDDGHRAMLRALGLRSAMIVPLVAHEHTLGALTFVAAESGRVFGADDFDFAEDLAGCAALAIENGRLHTAALAASQAKSSFLAVMSHELRTPLTSMMGYAELIADGITGPVNPPQEEQLHRIIASGRHLLTLIEEILTFSRLEAGHDDIHLHPASPTDIAQRAMALTEPLAADKRLRFALSTDGAPAEMLTDMGRVQQILINLLANAVNFTERGEVELQVRSDGDGVRFDVRDTGPGIAPEFHERIFDAFWQVEHPERRHRGGTGLGLTVSRRLARLLGGDVTLCSAPGAGSVFTLRLPLHGSW